MTVQDRSPEALRSFVIRGYWEGQEHPSIECPLGDFFGFAHGRIQSYQSAVHSLGSNGGLNIWLPMPFKERARFTLTNETKHGVKVYYQIDYTIGRSRDRRAASIGRDNSAAPRRRIG